MIVIGATDAGLDTLAEVFASLPPSFAQPVLVVGLGDATSWARLPAHSTLPVSLVYDKTPIMGGRVYIAPADYHVLVDDARFALSIDAKVHGQRPSVRVLVDSALDAYDDRVALIALEKLGEDVTDAFSEAKKRGGTATALVGVPVTEITRHMISLGERP